MGTEGSVIWRWRVGEIVCGRRRRRIHSEEALTFAVKKLVKEWNLSFENGTCEDWEGLV